MKKTRMRLRDASTSQHDLSIKPFGFCCDIKEQDPKLLFPKKEFVSLFPLSKSTNGEGPDVKLRIQDDDDVAAASQRSAQRAMPRIGQRFGQRVLPRGKYRGNGEMNWGDKTHALARLRGIGALSSMSAKDRMTCKRCRGPLQWYLEDELAVAREIMMINRQQNYNAEMEHNIKIAKKKERRKKRKKKILSKVEEDVSKEDASKEDTYEDDVK